MNARDVSNAIKKRYSDDRRFAVIEEVGLQTGFSHRRIDMVVVDCYQSNGFRIDGFEIKVSVPDLRRELAEPEKHVAFFDKIDYFTLACPEEVVKPLMDVIPPKWGILIINEDGSSRYKRRPLALADEVRKSVSRGFFASVVRAIQYKQPSQKELKEAYDRGVSFGKESEKSNYSYMHERVKKDYASIQAYDDMRLRFRLYGEDIDKVMKEFEAFRKIRPEEFKNEVKEIKKKLDGMVSLLEGERDGK